jgi:hypothetical protein
MLITHLHALPRSRTVELYVHHPTCLYDVVFNELDTGTALALHYLPYMFRLNWLLSVDINFLFPLD